MTTPSGFPEAGLQSMAGYALLRTLPPVLRARDFHLYTQSRREEGGRLVDLWQNGGAAVLGHKPLAVLREFKNAASRGLFGPLPHPLEKRFFKALARIFPRRSFRVYGPGASPAEIWEAAGLSGPVFDPALPAPSGSGEAEAAVSLWRPFLDEKAPLAVPDRGPPVLVPLLPGLGWIQGRPSGPLVLALDPAFEAEHPFPPPDIIPPALLAALTRGIYDLIAAAPDRGRPSVPAVAAALSPGAWRRRGIYLSPEEPPEPGAWEVTFRRFLEGGFLIPPDSGEPLILPGLLSPGEGAKLAGLFRGKTEKREPLLR
ncbi:MAG: hypothetical protein LBG10_09325 [Treponema sp.]|jgi:hypothetical protein|nr:hypothetical protein [Treponema sp.]